MSAVRLPAEWRFTFSSSDASVTRRHAFLNIFSQAADRTSLPSSTQNNRPCGPSWVHASRWARPDASTLITSRQSNPTGTPSASGTSTSGSP